MGGKSLRDKVIFYEGVASPHKVNILSQRQIDPDFETLVIFIMRRSRVAVNRPNTINRVAFRMAKTLFSATRLISGGSFDPLFQIGLGTMPL